MAGPYTIDAIVDILQASTSSVIADQRGRTLPENSRVRIYANRETIEVTATVTVGSDEIVSDGSMAIQATIGNTPIVPDNLIADTFGFAGDEIVIRGRNTAAAAAREIRVLVFVTPVDDDVLQQAMNRAGV